MKCEFNDGNEATHVATRGTVEIWHCANHTHDDIDALSAPKAKDEQARASIVYTNRLLAAVTLRASSLWASANAQQKAAIQAIIDDAASKVSGVL